MYEIQGSDETKRFCAALLGGDRREAVSLGRDAVVTLGLDRFYEEVMRPALYEVGRLWVEDAISVAHEHLGSVLSEYVIASLYSVVRWPRLTASGPIMVLACVAGNQHRIGLRMFADIAMLDGWDCRCLGADTPTDALVSVVEELNPAIVGLSVSSAQDLVAAEGAIQALRERVPGARVLVGGYAVVQGLAREQRLGADYCARSVADAMDWVRRSSR